MSSGTSTSVTVAAGSSEIATTTTGATSLTIPADSTASAGTYTATDKQLAQVYGRPLPEVRRRMLAIAALQEAGRDFSKEYDRFLKYLLRGTPSTP